MSSSIQLAHWSKTPAGYAAGWGSETQVSTENKLSTGEVGIVKNLRKRSSFREGATALPQPAVVMQGVCVCVCARTCVCVLGLLANLQTGNPIFKKYLFSIYLACQVLAAALGTFSCGVQTPDCGMWDLVP